MNDKQPFDTTAAERLLGLHPLLQEALLDQVTVMAAMTREDAFLTVEWAKNMRETMGAHPMTECPTALVLTGSSVVQMVRTFGPRQPLPVEEG